MGNISRKSKKKLIQKMKATYHEIQLIKIMYTEEALPRYKFPQNCITATMDEIITRILQCSLEKRTIRGILFRFTSIM